MHSLKLSLLTLAIGAGYGNDYGDEVDLSYARPIPGVKGLVAMAKYADYSANDYSTDTRKFWTQLQYSY